MRYESIPERIKKYLKIDEITGCWIWTDRRTLNGYAIAIPFLGERWKITKILHTLLIGPVDPDHEASHICPNRACCRPDPKHVIFETHAENMKRIKPKRHTEIKRCRKGHEMDDHNTCIKGGIIRCRICYSAASRARQKIRREKNKQPIRTTK